MANTSFKGFLAHVYEGKDVPTSDADDRQHYALCLHPGAFVSDADDADGSNPRMRTQGVHGQLQNPKVHLMGG